MNIIIYVDQQEKKATWPCHFYRISVWGLNSMHHHKHLPNCALICFTAWIHFHNLQQCWHPIAWLAILVCCMLCTIASFLISIPTWYRYSSSATKWQKNNHYSLWSLKGNTCTVEHRVFCNLGVHRSNSRGVQTMQSNCRQQKNTQVA